MKIKVMDININYEFFDIGAKDTLVLLHGWGQNIMMMMPICDRFRDKYNVLIIDLPGFGKSDEPKEVWGVYEYTLLVKNIIDKLNIKSVMLIGHSFGGRIALVYAAEYPVKKLVCLASPYCKELTKLPLKNRIYKQAKKIKGLKWLARIMQNKVGSEDYKNASEIMRGVLVKTVNTDLSDFAKRIKAPTLLIWGSNDEAVPVTRAYELEKLIKDAGVVVYEGATHYAYLERINEVVLVIDNFFSHYGAKMKVLISICLFLGYLFIKMKKYVHILQQNFYNENNRYLKWGYRNIYRVLNIFDILVLLINMFNLIFRLKYLILFNVIYLWLFIYNIIKKETIKIPLKVTKRVMRIIGIYLIILIIPAIIYNKNIYVLYFIYSLLICFNYLIVFLSNLIDWPVEKIVYCYYRKKAIKKLKASEVITIGITGSCGKTSTKNILNDVLGIKFNVLATPRNFNTKYGLIITINNYLERFDEVFIAEMGAFKVGSIKSLCELVHPKYGIITNIGLNHLESFHSRENIRKAKFELIESLPYDGIAILNGDDSYQVNYKFKNRVQIIWIGINNEMADVRANDIIMNDNGMNFYVSFKNDIKKYYFETRLLGKYNVYNILAAIALGKRMGMSINELQLGVKNIKTIQHRLEIKEFGDIIVIDDAYNANPDGAKMALDVLNLMPGVKIIVTPGMIELGEVQDNANMDFGLYMSKIVDYVILVGKKQTKAIYEGLIKNNYKEDNIFIINNVIDALKIINNMKINKKKYVLFENDLPDIFNEN